MRAPLATLCLVLMWNAPFAADESDPYSVAVVRSLLSLPPGASFGVSEKQNERLGDRAAIATLKLFDEADLTRPETIRKLLPVLRESFSYPQLISRLRRIEGRLSLCFYCTIWSATPPTRP